ncbi:DUF4747 domain-containing protein [Clostridium botulinum]|nr:DUF4747 domain-containing protein [Clostridium botulinum]NFL41794.1 DUF4747 domain-containing protein [Clostridium botulinum]NFN20790.1 DUF4747 domain-containing protein [Clostridium botulinum]NFN42008.1 DUF4747 domain-containing protein [Clostridium botulinum]NFO40900.1 DUF4747 domain-containing protein [Clostridium botulinum]
MSKTLYFAKVNMSQILEIIDDDSKIKKVMDKLFMAINNNIEANKIITKKVDGDSIIETHKFTFSSINKLENIPSMGLVGSIIKSHQIFVKQIDKKSGEKKVYPVDNDEIIQFFFSPYDEIVVFNTSNKFGYQQVCEAIQLLLNKSIERDEDNTQIFTVSILNNGVSIETIKEDLAALGGIDELSVRIVPPNPINKRIREAIKQNPEKQIKSYQDSKITEYVATFKSSYVGGLDTKSEQIENELNRAVGIHTKISDEDLLGNGYVKVYASGMNGIQYNSDDKQAIKVKVEDDAVIGDVNWAKKCRNYIKSLFKK